MNQVNTLLVPSMVGLLAMGMLASCNEPCPEGTTQQGDECVEPEETGVPDTDPVICPAYSGIVGPETRWEYRYEGSTQVGTYSPAVVSYDPDTGVVVVEGDDVGEGSTYTYVLTRRHEYLCDDQGLWVTAESTHGAYTYEDGDDPYSIAFAWDVPALVLPADLSVGDLWTTEYQGTVTYESGSTSAYTGAIDYEAAAEENVEVPAGSFTGMRVEAYLDGEAYFTAWHDRDAGLLRENYQELVSHEP